MKVKMPSGDRKETPKVPPYASDPGVKADTRKLVGSGSAQAAINRLNDEVKKENPIEDWSCGMD